MPENRQTEEIFIVDDDTLIRHGLSEMFGTAGYQVSTFIDGASFVAAARDRVPACVILDLYMPGRSGLQVLRDIDARNYPAPIFIASGRGDIPTAVEAIKNGAFDFFEKQIEGSRLVERVVLAVEAWQQRQRGRDDLLQPSFPGSDLLTPREREVLAHVAGSSTSKEAGRALGISPRTVEIHRAHIMQKLGAKNSVDLARKVLNRERRA